MEPEVQAYHNAQAKEEKMICDQLWEVIDENLPEAENKVWHAHPVWFLDGNPIVGYSKLKDCVRLLFWSGQSFNPKHALGFVVRVAKAKEDKGSRMNLDRKLSHP